MLLRRAVGILLTFTLSACWRYDSVGALPAAVTFPGDVRVQIYDGEVVVLSHASLAADTIRGVEVARSRTRAIPLAAVDGIEVKQFNMTDSVIFAVLVAALIHFALTGFRNRPFGGPRGPYGAAPQAPATALAPTAAG